MRKNGFAKVFGIVAALALGMGIAAAADNSPNADKWGTSGTLGGDVRGENQLTGELYADVMQGSVSIQREFRRALPSIYSYSQTAHRQERADAGFGSDAAYANTAEITSEAYAICPTTMCAPGAKWVMWDVPWIMNETRDRNDGYMGYRSATSGFATGISYMLGEASAIGFAVGYDARKIDARDSYHQRNRADALHLALYGGTNIGCLFLDGYAGWSRAWNRAERTIDVIGTGQDILKSNYDDDVFSAGLKASYVWILDNEVRITPSLGVDFSHVKLGSFDERVHSNAGSGVDTNLRSHGSGYTNLAVPVAVAVNKTYGSDFLMFKGARSLWTPEVRAPVPAPSVPSPTPAPVPTAQSARA